MVASASLEYVPSRSSRGSRPSSPRNQQCRFESNALFSSYNSDSLMPISFSCPTCGKAVKAPDAFRGQTATCPGCKLTVQVPMESDQQPSALPGPAPKTSKHSKAIRVRCPKCNTDFEFEGRFAGQTAACVCGERLAIPDGKHCALCGNPLTAFNRPMGSDSRNVCTQCSRGKDTPLTLFITGIFGCFSPICAIYGTIFLLRRGVRFPGAAYAIIGTALHWFWTAGLAVYIMRGGFR